MNHNCRKHNRYYQRRVAIAPEEEEESGSGSGCGQSVQSEEQHGVRMRGTKRKRHCAHNGETDGSSNGADIDAQIASLEKATRDRAGDKERERVRSRNVAVAVAVDSTQCEEADLVQSVEAQIEQMELLNVGGDGHRTSTEEEEEVEREIVVDPEAEDPTNSESNATDLSSKTSSSTTNSTLLSQSGPRDRDPSPALSAYAAEFSP